MDDGEENLLIDYNRSEERNTKLHDICNWELLDNVAIEYHDLQDVTYISYRELFNAKDMIADHLKCLKNEFVGIHFDIPEYCVPALMLGILSSEHSFVNIPLDAVNFENLKHYSRIHYLFCKKSTLEGTVMHQFMLHGECIIFMKLKHMEQQISPNLNKHCYAYGISTSGSTKTPKVVHVSHSCIVPNILDLSKILSIKQYDKIAQLTNFTFDPCIVEIFLALSNAASLFMVSKTLRSNPNRLLQKAFTSQITVLQITPTVFLHSWSTESLKTTILSNNSAVRAILLGGEPFPKWELLHETKHPQNNTKFYNIYGITEVSCWASINEMELKNNQYNKYYLGHVLSHTIFEVRKETGEVITSGTGSLYIGSNQRICAVDGENIETLELPIFRDTGDIVKIENDGRIFYKGRKDNIIKRFGNKIDMRVLEEFILQVDSIKSCYTIWDSSCYHLHLCVVAKEKLTNYHSLNNDIVKHLSKLDHLYRPDQVHFLEYIEFTSSGKISLQFLKEYYIKEQKLVCSTDSIKLQEIENIFKSIWEENLHCTNHGFVKLGGTSIAALKMTNSISKIINMEFPELIGMFLMDSTIDECLSYIKNVILFNIEHSKMNNFSSELDDARKIPLISIIPIEDNALFRHSTPERQTFDSASSVCEIRSCQWYKCRGQKCRNSLVIWKDGNIQYDTISNVKIVRRLDLKKCVDASPTVFHYSDGKTYVTVGSHSGIICTFGLEMKSCTSEFKIQLPDRIEASVLVLDDFRGVVGCHDGNVYCLNLKTGHILWKRQTGSIVKSTAILCKEMEVIFVGSYDCHVYCLSVKDGREIWKTKCSEGSVSASGCLHLSLNTVLFGTLDGFCLALRQSTGTIVWKRKLADPIFVAPALINNELVLFCSVTGLLCCFDIEINIKLWTYKINGNVFAYLLPQYNASGKCESIIVASQNKNVYCLQSEDANFRTEPTLKYVLSFHTPILATPWCENNFLFVVCTDGTLNIYNSLANKLVKIEILPGEVFSSPVVDKDLVIIGCRDNNVYVLQLV